MFEYLQHYSSAFLPWHSCKIVMTRPHNGRKADVFTFTALEYVSIKKRSLVGNLSLAIGLPIGGCLQAWILEAVGDWIIFHHILFSQAILYLISLW